MALEIFQGDVPILDTPFTHVDKEPTRAGLNYPFKGTDIAAR